MSKDITIDYFQREDTVFRAVMNSIFDGVYIVDRDRRIVFWNRGAQEITGYTAEEVSGRRCADNILNHIDENGRLLCTAACPLQHTLVTGEEVRAKVYPLHKSGRRFPVMTHIAPLRDGEGNIVAGIEVFRDISGEEDFRILQEKFNKLVQRYVSRSAYEQIMAQAESAAAATSRTRDLTILYLDVVGFTALSERHPAPEVVRILNDVFGICDVITRERNGDIDKFIGDALMAVFVDANDAVEASATIVTEALPHFNRQRRERGLAAIQVRVGINSGLVVQGEVGTTERKDLTVIGDVVNTAQRIESMCEPDSILISESTYARLRENLANRFEFRQQVKVKNKAEPIKVFALARPAS